MLRVSENPDPAAAVLDDGQDVHLGGIEQVGGEQVQRQERLCLGSQELVPARPSRRGAGSMPASLRICQTVDGATVTPSAASSPWTAAVTPRLILTRQPKHQRPDTAARRRASGVAAPGLARPAAAEDVTVPPQDGADRDAGYE